MLTTALLLSSVVIAQGVGVQPASASAPIIDHFSPLFLTNTASNGSGDTRPRRIDVVAVVRHAPGTSVNGVRFDLVNATSGGSYANGNCATTAHITCSGGYVVNGGWHSYFYNHGANLFVRQLPGQAHSGTNTASNYSYVLVSIRPPNYESWQNDGPNGSNDGICGIEAETRVCRNTASFSFRLSDGQTTADQTFSYFTVAESDSATAEDYPAAYSSAGTTGTTGGSSSVLPPTVTAGTNGAVTISYACDDKDTAGSSACDSAKLRFRRVGDNAFVNPTSPRDIAGYLRCSTRTSGPACETRVTTPPVAGNFDADDATTRTYTYRAPRTRGFYLIEANFCDETGACPGGSGGRPSGYDASSTVNGVPGGGAWQTLGSFYVNEAAPTVSFGTTTQTGGSEVAIHPTTGALRPRTGATLTFHATTSADTQVLDWNLDQNATNGISGSGYERRTYGTMSYASSPGTPTVDRTVTLDLSGYAPGTSCAVDVRAWDTGAINAADPSSRSATASRACTTNRPPTTTSSIMSIPVERGGVGTFDIPVTDLDGWAAGGFGGDESPTVDLAAPPGTAVTCDPFVPLTATTGRFPCTVAVAPNVLDNFRHDGNPGLSYTVSDSHGGTSATRWGWIRVGNTAPRATGHILRVQRGTTTTDNLTAHDPNGDTIDGSLPGTGFANFSLTHPSTGLRDLPEGSTLDCDIAGTCDVYVPPDAPTGVYDIFFTVSDNMSTANHQAFVLVLNTAPSADDLQVNRVERGRPATESAFQLSASDANPGDTITYEVTSTDELPPGTALDCDSAGACTIAIAADTPIADYPFSYRALNVNDLQRPASAEATVTIGVGNTAPVANPIGPLHTTVATDLTVDLRGTDHNGDTLTYQVPIEGPTKGTVTTASGRHTYLAALGTKGTDRFTYTVADGAATSAPATVTVEIDNSAPVADVLEVDAPRRTPTPVRLSGTDPNGDDLTFAVIDTTDLGALDCDPDGTCTYTSSPGTPDTASTDTFTFVANDGQANSAPVTGTITLTGSTPTADHQALEAPRRVPTPIVLTGTDPNGDDLTYAIATEPTNGTLGCDPDGTCTYTSNPGATGTDTFTFVASDGTDTSEPATVAITLTNSTPEATGTTFTVTRGIPKSFSLTGTDPNGDPLTYTLQDHPTSGTVGCVGAVCTYTASVTTGFDQLTFTAQDSHGATSSTATIAFSIRPVRVSIGDATVLEPDAALGQIGVVVPLTLSGRLTTDVTVRYHTQDLTATGGADYLRWGTPSSPRTVRIPAGSSWITIAPPIRPDGIVEPDETFRVVLQSAVAADGTPVDLGVTSADVTIIDSYDPADGPILWVHDVRAIETDNVDGQRAQFSIQLNKTMAAPIVVDLLLSPTTATEGPLADGGDFRRPAARTMRLDPTDTRRVYDVLLWGDTVTEDDEELVLTLVLPDGSPVVQGRSSGILTILDDD